MPGNLINKKSEVGRFSFEPTNPAFGFISRDFYREKLKSTVAICIIATVPLWSKDKELKELRASLETINKTSAELIDDVDRNFRQIC